MIELRHPYRLLTISLFISLFEIAVFTYSMSSLGFHWVPALFVTYLATFALIAVMFGVNLMVKFFIENFTTIVTTNKQH